MGGCVALDIMRQAPSRRSPLPAQHSLPTLVLCGREDVLSPVELHEELAAGIANSNLVVIEQCGHMSALEQPQQVAEAMQACLSAVRI